MPPQEKGSWLVSMPTAPVPAVSVIAPSSSLPKAHVNLACKWLKKNNFLTRTGEQLLGPDLLCAHTDAARAAHLKHALRDPATQVLWCLRGGYGALRLLPYLQNMSPPKNKKLFIGYSDATVLHLFFAQWGWPTLHAPNLRDIILNQVQARDTKALLRVFKNPLQPVEYKLKQVQALNQQKKIAPTTRVPKVIRAPLMGGNLSVLQSLVGTSVLPGGHFILKGQRVKPILCLEDVNEPAYKIDRMLMHLYLAGVLKNIRALVLGDLGVVKGQARLMQQIKHRWAAVLKVPVYEGLPIGHAQRKAPLPINSTALIKTNTY